jgi:hypothetical protein
MNCTLEKTAPRGCGAKDENYCFNILMASPAIRNALLLWALCTSRLKILILNKKHQQSLRLT